MSGGFGWNFGGNHKIKGYCSFGIHEFPFLALDVFFSHKVLAFYLFIAQIRKLSEIKNFYGLSEYSWSVGIFYQARIFMFGI